MGPLIMEPTSIGTEYLQNQYRGRDETTISNLHQVQDSLSFCWHTQISISLTCSSWD